MSLLPIGARVIRTGWEHDPWHGMKGTVVGHDLNERHRSPQNPRVLRYNLVRFDGRTDRTHWVEGHAGIVPLDPITLLGEIV